MIDQIPTTSRRGWARIEAEHDIAEADKVLGHPTLVDLLKLWAGLCRNGEPPAREDVDALILKPGIYPQIMLLEGVERNGRRDLRYRLIGTGFAQNLRAEMVGRYVRDVFADATYADELVAAAFLVIDGRQPIASTGRYVPQAGGEALMVYRLGLPLKKLPSGTPLLLVYQISVCKGVITDAPAGQPHSYEPGSLVAFADRGTGRSQGT